MKSHGGFVSGVAIAIACTISADILAQSSEDHQSRIEDMRKRGEEIRRRLEEQQEGDRFERKRRNEEEWREKNKLRNPQLLAPWNTSGTYAAPLYGSRERLFPEKDADPLALDSRPTRKVYGIDNRGDREPYPELIIEPSMYDRYEVYETDRDGLKKWEPKAIIKQGLYDRYEVYKTDRDGLTDVYPDLVIKENVYGDHQLYKTDRYGIPEDIPSRVIKTDILGRQQVYRTDRYGMPIGDPIDEKILE